MRVVLDTNVVVSALLRGGKPGLLIEFARVGRLQLFTSPPLVEELIEVVCRKKFTGILVHVNLTPSETIAKYIALANTVEAFEIARTASDPDDVVLATAKAAQADLLISGDRHLLEIGVYEGTASVNAATALSRIEVADQEPFLN